MYNEPARHQKWMFSRESFHFIKFSKNKFSKFSLKKYPKYDNFTSVNLYKQFLRMYNFLIYRKYHLGNIY